MKIYFIGIGGISMSAIAKYLKFKGFTVCGSDKIESAQTEELRNLGINVYIGGNEKELLNADIVVYTSAISSTDSELKTAYMQNKTIYKRVELLNEIVKSFKNSIGISGSHGKTTVTSMLAHIFKFGGRSFTAHIGGNDGYFGNMYTDGNRENFITEVCEYKKNILNVNCDVAVVLNIDNDHLDCYNSFSELKDAFYKFISSSKRKIVNLDDLNLIHIKNAVTFGINSNADFVAKNLKQTNGFYSFDVYKNGEHLTDINLKIEGIHNVYNSLCAFTVAYTEGISVVSIKCAIENFKGVKRRFEFLGDFFKLKIYADYCHHPKEIKYLIKTAYEKFGDKVLFVFQPHTYSRTEILLEDFKKVFCGKNVVFYKTYPAREEYNYNGSAECLAKICDNKPYFSSVIDLKEYIERECENYDAVFILGAGDLYNKFLINN